MDKITIKNISNATVSLFVPEIKLNRDLIPGRAIIIDKDAYNDLTFDPGFNSLVNAHYISIEGIEENDEVEVIKDVYTKDDINKMLDTLDVTAFAKFIPTAAPAEKETVVDLAVEKGITNSGFVTLIKKYCGRDVIELINMRHQEEV
jgi:hypothetical protein